MQRESRSLISSGVSERNSSIFAKVSTARFMSLPWGDDAGGVDAVPLKPLLGVRFSLRSGWADAISIAEASLAGSRLRVISRLECCSELPQVKDVYVRHVTSQIYNRSGNVIQRVMPFAPLTKSSALR